MANGTEGVVNQALVSLFGTAGANPDDARRREQELALMASRLRGGGLGGGAAPPLQRQTLAARNNGILPAEVAALLAARQGQRPAVQSPRQQALTRIAQAAGNRDVVPPAVQNRQALAQAVSQASGVVPRAVARGIRGNGRQ